MEKIRPRLVVFYLTVVLLSIINYESDLVKFLFTGYSATYDVVIIKHSRFVVIALAALVILISIADKIRNTTWIRYITIIAFVFWALSMRTLAYVSTDDTLISGWSFIRFNSYKCSIEGRIEDESEAERCEICFDPFLDRKLKNELKFK